MTTEKGCGSVHTMPLSAIADTAARWIMQSKSPRALTIDPDGRVCVERPSDAAECDVIGHYTRSLGLLELSRWILADLRHECEVRSFRKVPRRMVVRERKAA